MLIESAIVRGYQIFRIKEKLTCGSDISQLKASIEECLHVRRVNIALSFEPSSYLSSGPAGVLTQCLKMILEHSGNLALIRPGGRILDRLIALDVDSLVKIYGSEDDIGRY